MPEPEAYLKELEKQFSRVADPKLRPGMEAYMKNKFKFFGIQAGPRRSVSRKFIRKEARPSYSELPGVIRQLWEKPEREFQYFGTELTAQYAPDFQPDIIELLEHMITQKSWWDTVDAIAKNLAGAYFLKFPDLRDEIIEGWSASGDFWLQRTTLIFQLGYKDKTDSEMLFNQVRRFKSHEDFFIRKAIGWALREYSKTAPNTVRSFINQTELLPLSRREGLKILEAKK